MSQGIIWIIILVIALSGGGYWVWKKYLKKSKKAKVIPKDAAAIQPLVSVLKKIQTVKSKLPSSTVQPNERISKEGVLNAIVCDHQTRKFGPRHVDLQTNKNYGRQWDYPPYTGVYWLERRRDGSILPITPWEIISDSPSELYEAVQTTDDMTEVFGWQLEGSDKFKIIYLVIAAVVAIFIAFMAMTYKKAGG